MIGDSQSCLMNNSNTKIIILAAGRGSRLGVITDEIPKALVKIGASSCLEHQLKIYQSIGYTNINVVTGFQAQKFSRFKLINNIYNLNWNKSNMLTSLLTGLENSNTCTTLISYGDIMFEVDAIELIENSIPDISILYDTNFLEYWNLRNSNPLSDLESFKIQSDGLIYDIGQKPLDLSEIEGQYMGILKITSKGWTELLNYLDQEKIAIINNLSMTEFLSGFISKGGKVYGVPFSGKWCEIDTYSDLVIANKLF